MSSVADFTNLLLADAMARRYGLNRTAAVQRWARRARVSTKDPKIFETATLIAKCKEPHKVTKMIDLLHTKLVEEGVL